MSETRINGSCTCGRRFVKILNSEVPTMWLNGDRYVHAERAETSTGCQFRCEGCLEVIDENFHADVVEAIPPQGSGESR